MRPLARPLLLALFFATGAAHADEEAEPIRVRFEAPAACTDEARFFDEVRSHTRRIREARAEERTRTFRVHVGSTPDGAYGTLSIEEGLTVSAPRRLEARSCEQVVVALAFVAALSVDPGAQIQPLSALPPPAPPPALPPAVPPTPTDPEIPTPASLPAVSPTSTEEPTRPRPSSRFFVAVGLGPTLTGPSTPSGLAGGRAFVEIGRPARTLAEPLAPSLRLSFDLPSTRDLSPSGTTGRVTLHWTRGSADLCPARWALGTGLAFAPCAGIEGGVLEGTATQIVNARSSNEAWLDVFAEARLRWELLRVVFLEIDAGPAVPITREQFSFAPSVSVYSPPLAYFRGLVAAGAHFP